MGTKIDITLEAVNYSLTDTLAAAKMTAVNLSTGIVDGLDVTITSDVTTAPAAGTIRRVIQYTFGPTFLSMFVTNADQDSAFIGVCKKRIETDLPCENVTEARAVS